jgi:hypothetical protein
LSYPPPERGSVIRYAYLWADENAAGREEGRKDRPVLALALSVSEQDGATRVLVLPITHSPRIKPLDAVAIPPEAKRRLGLDAAPAWIVTTEANAFAWPGPDIRPVPGRRPRTAVYGRVPGSLLRQVARSFLAHRERQRSRLVPRTQ